VGRTEATFYTFRCIKNRNLLRQVLSPGWRAGWTTLLCWFSFFYEAGSVADVETVGASVVHHLIYQKKILSSRLVLCISGYCRLRSADKICSGLYVEPSILHQSILKIKSSKQGQYCVLAMLSLVLCISEY
jgi:hypothetical protein